MDAYAATRVLGLSCLSLLSESLKLYLHALQHRMIGYTFPEPKKAFKSGFLTAHLRALAHILETDWSDRKITVDGAEERGRFPASSSTRPTLRCVVRE